MANAEHMRRLLAGVEGWNAWRGESPDIRPDLSETNLRGNELIEIDLRETDLRGANLIGADLRKASLIGADLREVDLSGADLREAELSKAQLWETTFANTNLGRSILEYCRHRGPSTLDHRTLIRSGGLPEVFLRGCGWPDELIATVPALLNDPIQFYSCFISYSHLDDAFATRLHADLQDHGVRCWFAPHDLRIGDRFHDTIDRAIRLRDKLLVILSANSLASKWVEDEIQAALEEERRGGERGTVLFPLRIDDAIETADVAWATRIRRTRHIGDLSRWIEHEAYQAAFARLLRDLKAEGGA